MTEPLYMDDCYTETFRATVKEVGNDYIVLDKTAFYPKGGGQPADLGTLKNDSTTVDVEDVFKQDGDIRHRVPSTGSFEEGQQIKGAVDWDRRYKLMRMHTAQHLVSAVVLEMFDAETAGNQIHPDHSRIDFKPARFSDEELQKIQNRCNSLIEEEREVRIYEKSRDELEEEVHLGRTNLDLIPDHIDPLRVVEIEGFDLCPCGGTHVSNLDEIGRIEIQGRQSKGSETDRITFEINET